MRGCQHISARQMFLKNVFVRLKPINSRIKMYKLIAVITLFGFFIGFVWTEKGDSFFGTSKEDVCEGRECPEPQANVVQPSDTPSSTPQPKEQHDQKEEINIIITFTQAVHKRVLQDQFTLTVKSMFEHSSLPLVMHIIGETESQKLAENIIQKNSGNAQYRVWF